jgi:hypothetical protein
LSVNQGFLFQTDRVLPDVEAQEIKPWVYALGPKGVDDVGLTRFEL